MGLQNQVREIVRQEGMVARKEHPGLTGSMARLPWQGELVSVLPGVGVPAGSATDQGARVLAPSRWDPDAVLTGRTAARLTFSPSLPGSEVECAFAVGPRPAARVPVLPTQGSSGARRPPGRGAGLLPEPHGTPRAAHRSVLRTRTATLAGLWEAFALTGGRRGNPDRRALLLDSRDEPWSAAERLAHRLLRGAGVTGWKVNWPDDRGGRPTSSTSPSAG